MHSFEPQFSLQGAFHGKLALSVCSNGACEATDRADSFIGGGNCWYEVQSVEILSVTTTTTKTKTIESLQTERITPEEITGKGERGRVEAAALPMLSPHRRAQLSGEVGIISRDGWEFRPRGDVGICPRGSGGGRPPTMVRRPCVGA